MNTRPSGGIHLVSCAGVLGVSRCEFVVALAVAMAW